MLNGILAKLESHPSDDALLPPTKKVSNYI